MLQPWQLLAAILAGWVNEQQQRALEFKDAEIQMLLKRLGKKRLILGDDERGLLAVKGKALGRKQLATVSTLFTPDTILRWHRKLVAEKWDHSENRQKPPGRPPLSEEIVKLVLRMAGENPSWGYDRIQGALANLGHKISDSTVGNILRSNGIEPVPTRKRGGTTWKTFLQVHWDSIASLDSTTVEVWTRGGLVTFYLLFVMRLSTRRVHFAGCTTNPDGSWMAQAAKNLTDCEDGFLSGQRYLLMDRDTKFTEQFQGILSGSSIESVKLPPRSPNLNAHIERFMRSIKEECLDRMIFFGEKPLRHAVSEFVGAHYHSERNHQGLDNQLIEPGSNTGQTAGTIECRERLGGLLRYYHRSAA